MPNKSVVRRIVNFQPLLTLPLSLSSLSLLSHLLFIFLHSRLRFSFCCWIKAQIARVIHKLSRFAFRLARHLKGKLKSVKLHSTSVQLQQYSMCVIDCWLPSFWSSPPLQPQWFGSVLFSQQIADVWRPSPPPTVFWPPHVLSTIKMAVNEALSNQPDPH